MNKDKKKLKFNWVDLIIILAIAVLIYGAFARFGNQVQETIATTEKVQYKLQVKTVRQVMIDYLEKSIGARFNMGEKARSDELGKLVDLSVTPAKDPIEMANGNIVIAEIPERYDAVLTFELDAIINSTGHYTPQLSNIGIGTQFIIKNKYIMTQATVIELNKI